MDILYFAAGLALGAIVVFLALRARGGEAIARAERAEAELRNLRERLDAALRFEELAKRVAPLEADLARVQGDAIEVAKAKAKLEAELESERKAFQVAREQLSEHFKAIAKDALDADRERAKAEQEAREKAIVGLVQPLRETLQNFDKRVEAMDKARAEKDGLFNQQIGELGRETRALVQALKTPHVKGRWGERTLHNTVTLAGMSDYVDFAEQESVGEGGRLRPDMIVRMPAGRVVVVDAKAPTAAFLAAVEASDETARAKFMADHARQVRDHFKRLSAKSYWEQFPDAPEFVVMFVPGESFFSAAVQADPALLDDAANDRVLIATPTTLISLLWTVERGWRQEKLAENARAISDQGRELFKRMSDMAGHVADVGSGLKRAVDAYNKSVGSLESRVFPAARKLNDLGAGPEDAKFEELKPLDTAVREIAKPELLSPPEPAKH
ncbi:MAG: DNA recombination protein RmuC [Tagaea sp. CACIAM 22H2]|nr:DNA recombination protein RmuC [Tagaea sp. CACIAM 22H2]